MRKLDKIVLSKHFTLGEFLASATALANNIDNTPKTLDIVYNLQQVALFLEQLRIAVNKPITITSGYRCERLNELVKGVPNSYHVKGLAADIKVPGYTPNQLKEAVIKLGNTTVKPVIEPTWLHIQISL